MWDRDRPNIALHLYSCAPARLCVNPLAQANGLTYERVNVLLLQRCWQQFTNIGADGLRGRAEGIDHIQAALGINQVY